MERKNPQNNKQFSDKTRTKKITVGAVIIIAFVLGWIFGAQDAKFSQVGFTPKLVERDLSESEADFSVFWRAWDLIIEKYDGELDYQKMIYGAIRGLTDSLDDPYTSFLTPDEASALEDDLSGVIYGIGAEIGIKNDQLTIVSPISGSPAEEAGLLPGDAITYVDDEPTAPMRLDEAVYKIRGEEGTTVNLTIRRGREVKEYEIERAKIVIEGVTHEIIEGDIGLIEISRFDEKTTSGVQKALDEFISKNIGKIILDLRGNPGGYLSESISVSSEFLDEGVVVTEKREVNERGDKHEYKASGRGRMTEEDVEIVVLINGGSASASEIVAGALKDHDRAVLVGEETFGKGSVQEVEYLSRGAKLKITIAHWYTPNGLNISETGITPDHEVELTKDDYDRDWDPQLEKAIEILN